MPKKIVRSRARNETPLLIFIGITDGKVRRVTIQFIGVSVVHSCRFINMFADIAEIVLTTHFFDNCAQQHEPGVAIAHTLTGLKQKRLVYEQRQIIFDSFKALLRCFKKLWREIIIKAGSVCQQVMNLYLFRDFLIRIIGQNLANRIIERELSLLDELSNRHGGHHLVHRAEIKLGIYSIGNVISLAGETIGILEDGLTILDDQDAA